MKTWGVTIVVGLCLLVGWCAKPTVQYRYLQSIEIETPQGVRSGTSVIEISKKDIYWGLPEMQGRQSGMKGEATFIDLGGGKHIIAILDREDPRELSGGDAIGQKVLGAAGVPTLVTFTDITNPATAKVVRGETLERVPQSSGVSRTIRTPIDEIAATFGQGYAFRRATVEIVPAGVWPFNLISAPWPHWLFGQRLTTGIEARLPKWAVSSYDDVRNPDGSPLTQDERLFLIRINRSFKRNF